MCVLGDRSGSGGMYKPSSKFLPDKKEETPALVKPPPTPNQKPVVGVHVVNTVYCLEAILYILNCTVHGTRAMYTKNIVDYNVNLISLSHTKFNFKHSTD